MYILIIISISISISIIIMCIIISVIIIIISAGTRPSAGRSAARRSCGSVASCPTSRWAGRRAARPRLLGVRRSGCMHPLACARVARGLTHTQTWWKLVRCGSDTDAILCGLQ